MPKNRRLVLLVTLGWIFPFNPSPADECIVPSVLAVRCVPTSARRSPFRSGRGCDFATWSRSSRRSRSTVCTAQRLTRPACWAVLATLGAATRRWRRHHRRSSTLLQQRHPLPTARTRQLHGWTDTSLTASSRNGHPSFLQFRILLVDTVIWITVLLVHKLGRMGFFWIDVLDRGPTDHLRIGCILFCVHCTLICCCAHS